MVKGCVRPGFKISASQCEDLTVVRFELTGSKEKK
jgi:hypothetical protein